MKRIKKMIAVIMIAAMTVTAVSFADTAQVSAKKVVKSLKVKDAKKSLTMIEGTKKTFKVKVKAEKKKTAFSVKSSNKKIVKVSKKGKKITLIAMKPGKAKVTVKSKFNKKKKYVIKIKVVAKTTPETTKTQEATTVSEQPTSPEATTASGNPATAEATTVSEQPTSPEAMTATDNPVTTEATTVSEQPTNPEVTTASENPTNWEVTTSFNPTTTEITTTFVNPTTTEVTTTSENPTGQEVTTISEETTSSQGEVYSETYNRSVSITAGEEFSISFNINYGRADYKQLSIENVPVGMTDTFKKEGRIIFEGIINQVGTYTTILKTEDARGIVYVFNITFVVGNNETLVAFCPDEEVYAYDSEDYIHQRNSSVYPKISGGSGNYRCELLENESGIFAEANESFYDDSEGKYYYDAAFQYTVRKPGTYKTKVKIVDIENTDLYTTVEYTLVVKSYIKVTGKVATKTGKPVADATIRVQIANTDILHTDSFTKYDGSFTVYVEKGVYDFYAVLNDSINMQKNKNIANDTTINIELSDLHTVDITADEFDAGEFGNWYDKSAQDDTSVGYGNVVYLKAGTYQLVTAGQAVYNKALWNYEATVSVTVTGDTSAKATVTFKDIIPVSGTLNVGDNNVSGIDKKYKVYKFVAPKSANYLFKSDFDDDDVAAVIFDEDYDYLESGDDEDDWDFEIEKELIEGQTYYLAVYVYEDYTCEGTIAITEVKE